MLTIKDVVFNSQVKVNNEDVAFEKCQFLAQGSSKKDVAGMGLVITGAGDAEIKDCYFKNKGYSAIHVKTSGKVDVVNNTIVCADIYNPIEGAITDGTALNNVNVEGNSFVGTCGNNYINFYKLAQNAQIKIINNTLTGVSKDAEILRLSNPANVNATFTVEGNAYSFATAGSTNYTAFLMCQDYTNKTGTKQDFSKYTLNIKDLRCNGRLVKEGFVDQGSLFFVYEDGKGIITDNNPVINLQ